MDLHPLLQDVLERIAPQTPTTRGFAWWALIAVAVALLAVSAPMIWHRARLAVTIVHELGHAAVGMALGRRFTGFVVSADMSGHAITVGPRTGFGRVASTWAGYPAPAVVGALLIQLSLHGWGGAVLLAAAVILLISLFFARSGLTVLAVLAAAALAASAWWWGGPRVVGGLVLAAGVLLLLGAWRHLGAVISGGGRRDDPGQLAELTRVPALVWCASYVLVLAACTWWGWTALSGQLL